MARLQSTSRVGTSSLPALRYQQKAGITHPSEIAGFIRHFMANSLNLGDGDSVSVWGDESGADAVTQITGANQPTFHHGVINGWPVVRFDGTNDFMDGGVAQFSIGSIAAVFNSAENPFTSYRGILTGKVSDNDHEGLQADGAASSTSIYNAGNTVYIDGSATNSGELTDPTQFHAAIFSSTAGETYTTGLRVGRDRALSGRRWFGDVAEIIVYSATLSEANRALVFSYLNNKYNIY